MTYTGFKQYGDELQNLKVIERKEVTQKIREAREQGDLSENAEYDATRDEQRGIELRIKELKELLKNAEVMVENKIDLDKINIRCKVKLPGVGYDEETEFYIVGPTEANDLQNKINNESPTSRALISKVVDDCVGVETQAGDI